MKVENVLIEHLPRLRCANFSLLFDQSLEDVSSVRVLLRPTEIFVGVADDQSTTIDLDSMSVQIQINSLSLLLAKNNLISFRINIASSFQEEILPVAESAAQNRFRPIEVAVRPSEPFHLICGNCHGPLTASMHFRRILELPSENMDLNEWFCHKPHSNSNNCNGHDSNHHPETTEDRFNCNKFIPNEDDLYYGNFFIVLNRKHFTNIHASSSQTNMAHCRRCLNHVGDFSDKAALKLWNDSTKIVRAESTGPPQRIFADAESIFSNFSRIVERISYDFQMLGRQSQKLLFEARNRIGTTTYLFVQTMARNLELYQMLQQNSDGDSTNSKISMHRVDGIKCLFRCEQNSDQALLKFWMNDVNVIGTQVSIEMLESAVENLQRLSKFVPEQFRMNNGFCMSYLSTTIR